MLASHGPEQGWKPLLTFLYRNRWIITLSSTRYVIHLDTIGQAALLRLVFRRQNPRSSSGRFGPPRGSWSQSKHGDDGKGQVEMRGIGVSVQGLNWVLTTEQTGCFNWRLIYLHSIAQFIHNDRTLTSWAERIRGSLLECYPLVNYSKLTWQWKISLLKSFEDLPIITWWFSIAIFVYKSVYSSKLKNIRQKKLDNNIK